MPKKPGKRGGKRPGAGRKTKAVEQNLSVLLSECVAMEQMAAIIRKLGEDAAHASFKIRHEARKLLLAYKYGKPVERQELSGAVDVNIPSPDELKKKFEERRKSVEALDD